MDDNGKKLTAAIRLYALNGKGYFLRDAIKEIQGIVRSPAGIDPQDTITGTVVHGGILIQAGSNFAGIHLHPLTGNRALVMCEIAFAAICYQRLYQMVAKNLVNGGNGKRYVMEPFQLALYASGSQIRLSRSSPISSTWSGPILATGELCGRRL